MGEIRTLDPQAEAYTTDLTPVLGEVFTSGREGWHSMRADGRGPAGTHTRSGNLAPPIVRRIRHLPQRASYPDHNLYINVIRWHWRQEPFCVDRKTYAKLSAFFKCVIKFVGTPQTLSLRKNMRRTIKRNTYLIFIFLPYPIPNLDYISHTRFCDDNN